MAIEVDFLLIHEVVASFLSMKGMLDNYLEISIQNKTVGFGERVQTLTMANYLLIHTWTPDYII